MRDHSCPACRDVDRHHAQESEAARASREAQRAGDHAAAAFHDRIRVRALDAAGAALARCRDEEGA
jgi:hypothetical protein